MKRAMGVLVVANIAALVVTLFMNGLSQAPDVFPNTVGELGESRAVFFLPAGYVFSIWGIIYTGLFGFVIFQARKVGRDAGVVTRVGYWFILSSIGNISWLILFLNDLVWASTIAMILILISLLVIYNRLQIGRRKVGWQELWAVHVPFSVYLGWISVATIANISTGLYESGFVTAFAGLSADIWAVVMMGVAGLLGVLMLIFRRDVAYALVIVWALVGIYARPFDVGVFEMLAALNAELVNNAALIVTGVILVAVLGRIGYRLSGRAAALSA